MDLLRVRWTRGIGDCITWMPVIVWQGFFVGHDYISFDSFRKSRLVSGFIFDSDCVLVMLLYTRAKIGGFHARQDLL